MPDGKCKKKWQLVELTESLKKAEQKRAGCGSKAVKEMCLKISLQGHTFIKKKEKEIKYIRKLKINKVKNL